MSFEAKILADSISESEHRLTTIQVTLPRFVLAEYNTHRVFSRNSASSRAIPIEKQIMRIFENPAMPIFWGKNQPGMKAREEISPENQEKAKANWIIASIYQIQAAVAMNGGLNSLKDAELREQIQQLSEEYPTKFQDLTEPLHKQATNRLIEPAMWQTIITTATEWDNFYALRAHPDAQPEIQKAARIMLETFGISKPEILKNGEWHLPLIQPDERDWATENIDDAKKVSVGRCARVSYLTHSGKRDKSKDIELHDTLITAGHMSPTEHVASPMSDEEFGISPKSGNFIGWHQYRKDIPYEYNYAEALKAQQKLDEEDFDFS